MTDTPEMVERGFRAVRSCQIDRRVAGKWGVGRLIRGHYYAEAEFDTEREAENALDELRARSVIEAMRDYFDEHAKLVSNMNRPRSDNNYGRTAAMIAEALK